MRYVIQAANFERYWMQQIGVLLVRDRAKVSDERLLVVVASVRRSRISYDRMVGSTVVGLGVQLRSTASLLVQIIISGADPPLTAYPCRPRSSAPCNAYMYVVVYRRPVPK